MPHPVKVSLSPKMYDLDARPELAIAIARIGVHWAEIEQELGRVFCIATLAEPAVAMAIIATSPNIKGRIEMVKTALALTRQNRAEKAFATSLERAIRSLSGRRNKVTHSIWTIHADYPDDLIRTLGPSDPQLSAERWTLKDFLALEIDLLTCRADLMLFVERLPHDYPLIDLTQPPPFWRLTDSEPNPSDNQDQTRLTRQE